jgi:rhodanese-related sulfurtransferase
MPVSTITPQQLQSLQQGNEPLELIDVRTPVEFREVHVDAVRNVPLDRLQPRQFMAARKTTQESPLYIFCRTGNRAQKACQQFMDAGFENVGVVEGGVQAWEQAGLPVVRGKKAMSLERQVRIAAGFLVLVGTVLGFVVSPYFLALSAFVGAGLMFAGITDTCGMGMLLARMPWNRVAGGSSEACQVVKASRVGGR